MFYVVVYFKDKQHVLQAKKNFFESSTCFQGKRKWSFWKAAYILSNWLLILRMEIMLFIVRWH